ncbi:hypothetical protein I7X12_08845 [Halosimplex litoreum]|uniref:Mechanosensitive ion channel n=1 Tax=Halosimplex litoreum TaxID=1198301 RepID=A0A7U3WAP9_9EURY|nr:hypothetical protein [Halosimplex litoreum]QPV64694.1 hypothetical protein I7X12_08845 [Halosimplex litoreum]
MQTAVEFVVGLATETVNELGAALTEAVPRLAMAVVFVSLAYVAIRVVLSVVRRFFRGIYPSEQDLIARLRVTIVGVFLWFGAALVLLNILGLDAIAASLADRDVEKRWTKEGGDAGQASA